MFFFLKKNVFRLSFTGGVQTDWHRGGAGANNCDSNAITFREDAV